MVETICIECGKVLGEPMNEDMRIILLREHWNKSKSCRLKNAFSEAISCSICGGDNEGKEVWCRLGLDRPICLKCDASLEEVKSGGEIIGYGIPKKAGPKDQIIL